MADNPKFSEEHYKAIASVISSIRFNRPLFNPMQSASEDAEDCGFGSALSHVERELTDLFGADNPEGFDPTQFHRSTMP